MSRLSAAAAVALALALGACGSSRPASAPTGPGAATSSARGTPTTCSRLTLAWVGTQGATGHLEVTLSLRNASASRCIVRGYPRARLLDAAGHPLALRMHRGGGLFADGQIRPQPVSLRPGAQARFGLSFVVNNEYAGAHICRTAAAAMALAPAASRWQRISLTAAGRPRVTPCGDRVVVSAVYAG